jgi:trehalose 6-phosphate phosphatase
MTVELRPPMGVDKGTAVTEIVGTLVGAAYLGDDLGDLPAFTALDALARTGTCSTINVAVADPESPDELLAAADVVTDGPPGALRLLEWLVQALPTGTG